MENFRLIHQVRAVPTASLTTPARLTRKHTATKIAALAASIADTGFFNPILIDEDDVIIAGHARVAAARRLGMETLPAFVVTGLSSGQKRRLALADNKLAETASWDPESLAEELRDLFHADPDSVDLTGFSVPEIDQLITPRPLGLDDEQDELPEPPGDPVSRKGDRWQCGPHVVVCGDATEAASYERAMGEQVADVVFTDPPYGLSIANEISQRGQKRHGDFVMASGEMGPGQLAKFFGSFVSRVRERTRDGAVVFVCIDYRHLQQMLEVTTSAFGRLLSLCVWVKTNAGLGTFYRSQHELVLVLRNGSKSHINNIAAGRKRHYRTNVWTYAGNTANTKARREELKSHPTVKPLAMIVDALEDVSKPGDLVLDPFGGSGSTMMAAHAIKRRTVLIELDPQYVDLSILRFQKATGVLATLDGGATYEEVQKQRQGTVHEPLPSWPRPAQP